MRDRNSLKSRDNHFIGEVGRFLLIFPKIRFIGESGIITEFYENLFSDKKGFTKKSFTGI
jgi:hypothetical protein